MYGPSLPKIYSNGAVQQCYYSCDCLLSIISHSKAEHKLTYLDQSNREFCNALNKGTNHKQNLYPGQKNGTYSEEEMKSCGLCNMCDVNEKRYRVVKQTYYQAINTYMLLTHENCAIR